MSIYNINIPVNKFYYQNFGFVGNIVASGLPLGLSLNNIDNSITGAPIYVGNGTGYIYPSGSPSTNTGIYFTVTGTTNTGYLYAFGPPSAYAQNSVPYIFYNVIVEQICAKNNYNLAVADQSVSIVPTYTPAPVPPPPPVDPIRKPPYSFIITNVSTEDCITNFVFTSSITGTQTGYIENKLDFGFIGGTPGANSTMAIVSSGYYITGVTQLT